MHPSNSKDITDGLDEEYLKELIALCEEPAEKDTISEEEYLKLTARWGTKKSEQ